MCPFYVLSVMDKLILNIGGMIVNRKETALLDKTYSSANLSATVSTLIIRRANPDLHTLRIRWATS
jgi:hypothetical protein